MLTVSQVLAWNMDGEARISEAGSVGLILHNSSQRILDMSVAATYYLNSKAGSKAAERLRKIAILGTEIAEALDELRWQAGVCFRDTKLDYDTLLRVKDEVARWKGDLLLYENGSVRVTPSIASLSVREKVAKYGMDTFDLEPVADALSKQAENALSRINEVNARGLGYALVHDPWS
ncbi:hypothetical protein JK358_35980 [Nocardia sp. 2]|uniref:Uncharacterized protein n=1 Tax=Nocardia acididurans TaxID=2802282 RepID=A0ABS1MGM3_9NOCA|nr:hypothetical protein [Nocardia acididurans]MBL1079816.1 hypothetical protein [Nocardia acididurans]